MGSWGDAVSLTQLTGVAGSLTAFQYQAADAKITAQPLEGIDLEVKLDWGSGTTDPFRVNIYCSNADAPGAVPDAGTSGLPSTDWSLYQTVVLAEADWDKTWKTFALFGHAWYAISVVRESGSTDSVTADARYKKDGVTN